LEQNLSTHAVEIVTIERIEPHPKADRLEIAHIWGWRSAVRIGSFRAGDRAIFIPPDFEVPLNDPQFEFLRPQYSGQHYGRIRTRRYLDVISQGLVIEVPDRLAHLPVGTNVMDDLRIIRYDPPSTLSETVTFIRGPHMVYAPKFDVESYERYHNIIQLGEDVIVTEKIHGANARYTFSKHEDGEYRMFNGLRSQWLSEDENPWVTTQKNTPGIESFCRDFPDHIVYGEVYGKVQSLKYGMNGKCAFAAFAVLKPDGIWMDFHEMQSAAARHSMPVVPVLYTGPHNQQIAIDLAEGDSSIPGANHHREGVVITPLKERVDPTIGRVCLKVISSRYFLSDKG
jgi:RNA ligase (TIGR02306 family)